MIIEQANDSAENDYNAVQREVAEDDKKRDENKGGENIGKDNDG